MEPRITQNLRVLSIFFLASKRFLNKGKLKLIVMEGHSSRVVLGTAMTGEKTKKKPGSPQAWATLKATSA